MKKKIFIIGSKNYSNRRILQELKNLGISSRINSPKDFTIHTDCETGMDNIYYKGKLIWFKDVDGIVPRIGKDFGYGVSVVRHMNVNNGCYTTSNSEGLINASDKQKCTQILSKAGLRTPSSAYFQKVSDYSFLTELVGGLPCVAKLTKGSQGKGVFILTDQLGGSTALKTAMIHSNVIIQQYIESARAGEKKSDIRAWVVGDKVVASMRRFSVKSDFRSNYSLSKDAEPVTLTETEKKLAVDAAKAIGLELCGVDLMREVSTNKTYVIEANGNASLYGIERVTNINVAKHIAEYVKLKSVNTVSGKNMLHQSNEVIKQLNSGKKVYSMESDEQENGLNFLAAMTEDKTVSTHEENMEFGIGSIPSYMSMSHDIVNRSSSYVSVEKQHEEAAKRWIG